MLSVKVAHVSPCRSRGGAWCEATRAFKLMVARLLRPRAARAQDQGRSSSGHRMSARPSLAEPEVAIRSQVRAPPTQWYLIRAGGWPYTGPNAATLSIISDTQVMRETTGISFTPADPSPQERISA